MLEFQYVFWVIDNNCVECTEGAQSNAECYKRMFITGIWKLYFYQELRSQGWIIINKLNKSFSSQDLNPRFLLRRGNILSLSYHGTVLDKHTSLNICWFDAYFIILERWEKLSNRGKANALFLCSIGLRFHLDLETFCSVILYNLSSYVSNFWIHSYDI